MDSSQTKTTSAVSYYALSADTGQFVNYHDDIVVFQLQTVGIWMHQRMGK